MKRTPALGVVALLGACQCVVATAQQAGAPELVLQVGHTADVNAVTFSPDGTRVVSGSSDSTVRTWEAATGTCLQTLREHEGPVYAVALSPDGSLIASGGADRALTISTAATGQVVARVEAVSNEVRALAFTPDGKLLVVGCAEKVVKLLDVGRGEVVATLEGHRGMVTTVAVSPDGSTIASAGTDDTVKLWDLKRRECRETLKGHAGSVRTVAFSPDGTQVASGGDDRAVKLWSAADGELLATFAEATMPVQSVAFSPAGDRLAAGAGGQIRVWEPGAGRLALTITRDGLAPRALQFSPDGALLASAEGLLNVVNLWNMPGGECARSLGGLAHGVIATAFSPDGGRLALGGGSATISVWNVVDGRCVRSLSSGGRRVAALAYSPDGTRLASGAAGSVELFDQTRARATSRVRGQVSVKALAFSPDGSLIASAGGDGAVSIRRGDTGALLETLTGHRQAASGLAFTPDGKLLVSGGWDGTVRTWRTSDWKARDTLDAHRVVWSLAVSPDGKLLATGHALNLIQLWNLDQGKVIRDLEAPKGHRYCSVAFSPDSQLLASGGSDQHVILWDAQQGDPVAELDGHTGPVSGLSFSPDGRLLASGSEDGTARLWEVATRRQLVALTLVSPEGDARRSPAADWLAATPEGYYDGSVRAARLINWRVGGQLFPVDAYEATYHRPDLVRRALGADLPEVQTLTGDQIPPAGWICSPSPRERVEGGTVHLAVVGSGSRDPARLEVYLNGRRASVDTESSIIADPVDITDKGIVLAAKGILIAAKDIPQGHSVARLFEGDVPLPPGEAVVRLRTVVYDREGMKGTAGEVTITRPDVGAVPGDLHVLAVGISQYANAAYDLRYAAADAQSVAAALSGQGGPDRLYARSLPTVLTDAEATAANIKAALWDLQNRATSKDTVIFFVSGHGLKDPADHYYLATHETDVTRLADTALPWEDFRNAAWRLQAKQVLMFIDTCHAESALGEESASTEVLAEDLAQRAGVIVLAGSTGDEASFEGEQWGHGAFTRALLDLLDGKGPSQTITLDVLSRYVPERVAALTDDQQHARIPLLTDFPLDVPLLQVQ